MVQEMFLHHAKADFMDMFATHPPIEKRIDALVKFAGGNDMPLSPEAMGVAGGEEGGPWGVRPSSGPWG